MKRPPDWLLAVILALGVFLWQRSTFDLWHIDLFHIQLAALSWHTDQPDKMYTGYADYEQWIKEWYRPQADRLGAWGDENAFFYPPFIAGILAPFSDVHVYVWRNILLGVNILLLFVFAWQIVRLIGEPVTTRGYLWALALVLICYPMARACKMGQIVPLLAAIFWEGLLRLRTSRVASSLLLGSAIAIKIFPAAWLAIPFFRKQWRVLVGISAVIAATYALSIAFMGLSLHVEWWNALHEFGSIVYNYFGNQSAVGWFTRAVLQHDLNGTDFDPTPAIKIARLVFIAIFLGGSLLLLFLSRKREIPLALESGLLISGLLLALPVSWEYYYMYALPPLGVFVYSEWKRGRIDFQSVLLVAAAFFFTMKLTRFYTDDPVGKIISGSQCFGLILMWVYCILRVQCSARLAGQAFAERGLSEAVPRRNPPAAARVIPFPI